MPAQVMCVVCAEGPTTQVRFAETYHPFTLVMCARCEREIEWPLSTFRRAPVVPKVQTVPASRNQEIRTWARAHGYNVHARGAVPEAVMGAYNKAHRRPSRR